MPRKSVLVRHVEREVRLSGLLDKDSSYGGMLGKAVITLTRAFAKQGHSGKSAQLTLDVFNTVARHGILTPLTDDPKEWVLLDKNVSPDERKCWQNLRKFSCFSYDQGKTYYNVDEKRRKDGTWKYHKTKKH